MVVRCPRMHRGAHTRQEMLHGPLSAYRPQAFTESSEESYVCVVILRKQNHGSHTDSNLPHRISVCHYIATVRVMSSSWLPAIAYPPEQPGFWEPHTSTIVWCEEKYYLNRYFAEIINTLTNLLFMYLAVKGMLNCWRNGHDRVFFVAFLGYLIVGSGSFAFHTTLKCRHVIRLRRRSQLTTVQTQCSS